MESNKNKISDVLGISPYGEAIKLAIEKGFEGASAVLSRICLPAAEELGLMFQDKVRYWRLNNIINIVEKAGRKFDVNNEKLQIHPRVIHEILEDGSWCEDNELQNMWAGLLASSVDSRANDSNILFVNSLKRLTNIQAKIINYICAKCKVRQYDNGLFQGRTVILTVGLLNEITDCHDLDQLDAEMDNLRANDLITIGGGGFQIDENPLIAELKPTAFLLNLFAKSQGHKGSLKDFYSKNIISEDEDEPQTGRIILG